MESHWGGQVAPHWISSKCNWDNPFKQIHNIQVNKIFMNTECTKTWCKKLSSRTKPQNQDFQDIKNKVLKFSQAWNFECKECKNSTRFFCLPEWWLVLSIAFLNHLREHIPHYNFIFSSKDIICIRDEACLMDLLQEESTTGHSAINKSLVGFIIIGVIIPESISTI
jgi:hypothetical protein